MTGTTLLIFVLGTLIGVLMGGALCVHYLRHEIAADICPRLRRLQLQLDNLESAVNLALVTRYAGQPAAPRGATRGTRTGSPARAVIAMPSPTAGPGNQGPGRLGVVWRTAAVVTGGVALALQACVPGLGSPAAVAAAGSGQLTCFALDVSGSNLIAAGGEPPSDPGPVFVRQQVVELFSEILADLGQATGQQVGVVTFGTGPGTRLGPLAVSAPATRATLATALPGALRPSSAEAAWTDWVAGVSGCEQMFKRAGDPHGMVVLLTDGFPQGPAGDPAAQLAAIAPIARQLRADGITMQPVLYGAGRPAGTGPPGHDTARHARARAPDPGRDAAGHAVRGALPGLAQHRAPARRVRVPRQRQHHRPPRRRAPGGRGRAGRPAQLQPAADLGRRARREDAGQRRRQHTGPGAGGPADRPRARQLPGQRRRPGLRVRRRTAPLRSRRGHTTEPVGGRRAARYRAGAGP